MKKKREEKKRKETDGRRGKNANSAADAQLRLFTGARPGWHRRPSASSRHRSRRSASSRTPPDTRPTASSSASSTDCAPYARRAPSGSSPGRCSTYAAALSAGKRRRTCPRRRTSGPPITECLLLSSSAPRRAPLPPITNRQWRGEGQRVTRGVTSASPFVLNSIQNIYYFREGPSLDFSNIYLSRWRTYTSFYAHSKNMGIFFIRNFQDSRVGFIL
jgi:hypothetical protein